MWRMYFSPPKYFSSASSNHFWELGSWCAGRWWMRSFWCARTSLCISLQLYSEILWPSSGTRWGQKCIHTRSAKKHTSLWLNTVLKSIRHLTLLRSRCHWVCCCYGSQRQIETFPKSQEQHLTHSLHVYRHKWFGESMRMLSGFGSGTVKEEMLWDVYVLLIQSNEVTAYFQI